MASLEGQGTTNQTEGGAVFGNLSATGDINIIHTTIRTLADDINAAFFASSYPDMFSQVQHELNQLIPFLGIAVAKYPEFKKDDEHFSALNKELKCCQSVLNDLQELQQYYENLPSQAKIAWERTGIGASSLTDLRGRITSSRQTFTMLNTEMIKLSQANITRYIKRWINEYRDDQKTTSIISDISSEARSLNEEETWSIIRQELEDVGMAPEAFERNKRFIREELESAISRGDLIGAFESNSSQIERLSLSSGTAAASSDDDNVQNTPEALATPPGHPRGNHPGRVLRNNRFSRLTYKVFIQKGSLFDDVEMGRSDLVLRHLRNGANIEARNKHGRSVLWLAANGGHAEIVRVLINNNCNLQLDNCGYEALRSAAKKGYLEVVDLLLKAAVPVDMPFTPTEKAEVKRALGPLLSAVAGSQEAVAELLLEHGANVNAKSSDGKLTALDLASRRCREGIVRLLLKAGAKVNRSGVKSNTPLHWATINDSNAAATDANQLETVKLLLDHGAKLSINLINDHRLTPLLYAITSGKPRLVKLLLDNGADVHKHTDPLKPLLLAVTTNDPSLVQIVLSAGAGPNEANGEETALKRAVELKNPTMVRILLEAGADVLVGATKSSILLSAAETNDATLVSLILDKNPDLDGVDSVGDTALWKAIRLRNIAMAKILLEKGANPDSISDGEIMLRKAIRDKDTRMILLLLQKEANPNVIDIHGNFPLMDAVACNDEDLATLLLDNRADPNLHSKDERAETPLSRAVRENNHAMVKLLLQKNAKVDLHGEKTSSALILACSLGHIQMVDVLLDHGSDVNHKIADGSCALSVMTASWRLGDFERNLAMIKFLFDKGANPNTKGSRGVPVIFDTIPRGRGELQGDSRKKCLRMLEAFLSAGADPNSVGNTDDASLLAAIVETDSLALTKLAIKKGANIESQDRFKRPVVQLAIEKGSLEMAEYLLEVHQRLGNLPPVLYSCKRYQDTVFFVHRRKDLLRRFNVESTWEDVPLKLAPRHGAPGALVLGRLPRDSGEVEG